MDLDDFSELDDENQTKVPARVPKFRPKSSLDKPLPKPEPKQPKIEENSTKSANLLPKIEKPSGLIGTVKMEMKPVAAEVEMKPVPDLEAKPKMDEPVDSSRNQLEEEEDMIVREIDVYYTPSIDADTKLYVMQYPLRPCWRPYELDERCEETLSSSWKPSLAAGYAVGVLVDNKVSNLPYSLP
ncbi:hypothetical protein Patl1_05493 [Pistacia atlantica]|uniref:Uncharacterized protein n=1 Tax=Pistacia atlantica TaxID=434234 RepID=A0ACC1BQZ0_9ROSI|nr:hypothetical protein Patl1_05493 [Pistacia atlantica]